MNRIRYNRLTIYRFFSLVSLLFIFSLVTVGQNIKINIKAPETVFVGEQVRVDYIVESVNDAHVPVIFKAMQGFAIVYGPTVSSSKNVSFKDGKRMTVYKTISSYYLVAQTAGKYTLPQAEVSVFGEKYKSEVVKIEIKSPKEITAEVDAFIKTIVSKTTVNLSDTLLITYRLYTTKEIERIISADFPNMRDFYSTNITRSRQNFSEEKINGKTYKVVDLRRMILQPKNIGQKSIPEGQISVEYSTPTGRKVRDMWGDIYDEAIRTEKTLTIDPVIISVQDLKAI
ncbi:BatD family protein [Prevotella sp. 10(H)]|uniref:BatD family protein n=1 Tax=Prevotella sp. 10(H) TaxID=1158294 RepID=UPI0004A712C4|nr:BatD family protein [Prevotella sp. 10(H)]